MPDVNVLIYAHRQESIEHKRYAAWLRGVAESAEPFALSELVLHGFVRIVTNSKIFRPPSQMDEAWLFIDELSKRPNCVVIGPGRSHWGIFRGLCTDLDLKGKLVADAVHAAMAIESGCEWISADTDFARFAPLLRWRHL